MPEEAEGMEEKEKRPRYGARHMIVVKEQLPRVAAKGRVATKSRLATKARLTTKGKLATKARSTAK